MASAGRWLVLALAVALARSAPMAAESHSLGAVSELGQRLVSHSSLLTDADARLPIPTPQDLEAIKKVAQILVMLGEQHSSRTPPAQLLTKIVESMRTHRPKTRKLKYVIPALVGDGAALGNQMPGAGAGAGEVPNDPVEDN